MTVSNHLDGWTHAADVVVVGLGAAGVATAVTAHDLDRSVIILEKANAAEAGGNTRVAGQGYLNTSDAEQAEAYLTALCGPYAVPPTMVRAWASEMCQNNTWLRTHGGDPQEHQHKVGIEFAELPGSDCVHKYHDGDTLGFSHTWNRLLSFVTEDRPAIQILYETPACKLIWETDAESGRNTVLGVTAECNGENMKVKARRGVVLTCGGFENNQDMIRNYLPGLPYCYTSGSPHNEGDGVRMAMEVGADLWHMNNFAGPSLAVKVPDIRTTLSMVPLHFKKVVPGGMIVIGADGRRFTDEKYKTRHGKVLVNGVWQRLATPCPMHMVFDHTLFRGAPLYDDAAGKQGWTPVVERYRWSGDNERELEKGWIVRADTLAQLAEKIGVDEDALNDTVRRWNGHAEQGADPDFGRSLMLSPLKEPPFYAVQLVPSMLNTQGGPRRNESGRVVRPDGTPIGRLYSAGELGSIFSYLYQGTGNLGECLGFGRISGRNVAMQRQWTTK